MTALPISQDTPRNGVAPAYQSSSQETPDPGEEADDPNSVDAEVKEEESTPVTTGPRRSACEKKPKQ